MFKPSNKRVLLFVILVFSFAYRLLLLHWATYPSGADIGLHNSVIYSITRSGNTDFLYNYYQMGGGVSLTFPGYHIFVSSIILLTGIPDFIAHSLVVSLFSTLIVAIAFLMTRKLWGESTAFIVAFLAAISRFDIEMLLWGGYPNVITLTLIPLAFYLYLERERFSLAPFLVVTTLLSGSIYLTHSLSAVMFASISLAVVFFAAVLSRKVGVTKKQLAAWVLPLFLGAAIVSPFLIRAVPAYLGANSETFTGGVSDIRQALLSTRVLPPEIVVPLFACVILFFLFSKEYKGKFLTVPAILLTLWIVVPMLFTQGYLVGLYTDYNRFLYFVLMPLIILLGLVVDHTSRFLAQVTHTYFSADRGMPKNWKGLNELEARLKPYLTRRNIYSGFLLGILLTMFLAVPLFLTPQQGRIVQSFYQVMSNPGYEAIQWARVSTPPGSVFVSDALYGWWFSGFAQRPTLSAVDPQYLTLSREFAPAKAAKSLLDTDYMIDNGLIQVREDGGYLGRHNPMFLAKLDYTYFPYPFFHFNSSEITVLSRRGDEVVSNDLTHLDVGDMQLTAGNDSASILVEKGNDVLSFAQETTVYKGVRFVNVSMTVASGAEDVSLDWVRLILHTKGRVVHLGNSVALVDEGAKVVGQLIFMEGEPDLTVVTSENPSGLELLYNLGGKREATISLSVGVFEVKDTSAAAVNGVLSANLASFGDKVADFPLDVFDYKIALRDWRVSYVACRDSEVFPKFASDPAFSVVFINDAVSVFMVKHSFT
jgi:hypothetical protein